MTPASINTQYCDYQKHQYYNKQGDVCKTCDRCPQGLGLSAIEEIIPSIDPVYGALTCRHCVPCPKGFYSEHYSHEECQPCTNCQHEGRFETLPCNRMKNAVCGNVLPKGSSNDQLANSVYIPIALSLVIAGIVGAIICYCLKKRRKRRHEPHLGVESSKTLIPKVFSSTVTTTSQTDASDLSTDYGYDSLSTLNNSDKIKDWKLTHDCWSHTVLSDRDALTISKMIAGDNRFFDIGIQLGVSNDSMHIIKADHKDVKNQAYETLIKWKHLKASEATVFKLLDGLEFLNYHDTLSSVCKYYEKIESEAQYSISRVSVV